MWNTFSGVQDLWQFVIGGGEKLSKNRVTYFMDGHHKRWMVLQRNRFSECKIYKVNIWFDIIMILRPGQWRLRIWKVWRGWNVWWWDGGVECLWKIESAVRICADIWVFNMRLMWWDMTDWDGLDILSVRVRMIECRLAGIWRWWGEMCG